MVLLALSSALVVGTFSASRAMHRSASAARERARVETEVTRALGEVLVHWTPALDSLPVGAGVDLALDPEPAEAGPALLRRARAERVAERLYAVTVDVRALARDEPLARRRARLWLQRDTGTVFTTPAPVTPWAFADLY